MNKDAFFYNKLWQEKRLDPDRLYMQGRVLKTLKTLFSEILKTEFPRKILDVGAGDGAFVEVCLRQNGIEAVAIDICDGVDFEKDRLPFNDHEFDGAVMYSVIEHLLNPGHLLLELRRILKPGGLLVIITPNFQLDNLLVCSRDFFNDPTHIHPYNPTSIRMVMKIYDFKERFIGLWTVCKSPTIWRLPEKAQFYLGTLLPFTGKTKHVPHFLKGKSKSILCVFENNKKEQTP